MRKSQRICLIAQVTKRWLEAGTLDPPPAMVKSIIKWVRGVAAAYRYKMVEADKAFSVNLAEEATVKLKTMKKAIADLKRAIPTASTRELWTLDRLIEKNAYSWVYTGLGHKMTMYQKLTPDSRKELLAKWGRIEKNIMERVGYHYQTPKQVRDSFDDALQKLDKYRQPNAPSHDGNIVTERFPIDLSGWKHQKAFEGRVEAKLSEPYDYLIAEAQTELALADNERDRLDAINFLNKLEKSSWGKRTHDWTHIWVEVHHKLSGKGKGSWSGQAHRLSVQANYPDDDDIETIVVHELRHFLQSYMTVAVTGSPIWLLAGEKGYKPGQHPGNPSKRVLTPKYKQHDKNQQKDLGDSVTHHLDDIEYNTDMPDALEEIYRDWKQAFARTVQKLRDTEPTPEMNRAFLRQITGQPIPREYKDLMYGIRANSFFAAVKKRAPGKYRLAVKELFKYFTRKGLL